MEQLYEGGLFMELGEVVGHDPNFYEDISKHDQSCTSSPFNTCHNQVIEIDNACNMAVPGDQELDSLLAEGNQLLEQLMASYGLELSPEGSVDLAAIDELSEKLQEQLPVNKSFEQNDNFISELEQLSETAIYNDYPLAVSPSSSITTLPSEPSSPVDLFSLQQNIEQEPSDEFTGLLESILDDSEAVKQAAAELDGCDYYDESLVSPLSSEYSYTDSCPSTEPYSDTVLSCLSPIPSQSDSPTKIKPKKKSKSTPYSKLPANRKERKKQQNKEAAIRYREKKRSEAQTIQGEEAELTQQNKQLKTEVLNLEREIMCMKELLSDVFNIHSL